MKRFSQILIFLALLFVFASLPVIAQEPYWIDGSLVPVRVSTSVRKPLESISTDDQGIEYQSRLLNRWSSYLGMFENRLTNSTQPKIEWVESVLQEPTVRRSLVKYETEPGQFVEAFILAPEAVNRTAPGVVVFHSTVNHSIYQCVGLADPSQDSPPNEDELRKAYALQLARNGFVTLSPKNFLWPEKVGIAASQQAQEFLSRNPSRKGMARMLLDAMCAVDVLLSLDYVDAQRIGAIGHSLGAKQVLYLGAFDPRVRAMVSSEGGLGIEQSNWEADWYLGRSCKELTFDSNHHELLAMMAPRAFLLIGGEASDGTASEPYLNEAAKVYAIFRAHRNLAFINHRQGHKVTDGCLKQSLEWLDWQLSAPPSLSSTR